MQGIGNTWRMFRMLHRCCMSCSPVRRHAGLCALSFTSVCGWDRCRVCLYCHPLSRLPAPVPSPSCPPPLSLLPPGVVHCRVHKGKREREREREREVSWSPLQDVGIDTCAGMQAQLQQMCWRMGSCPPEGILCNSCERRDPSVLGIFLRCWVAKRTAS